MLNGAGHVWDLVGTTTHSRWEDIQLSELLRRLEEGKNAVTVATSKMPNAGGGGEISSLYSPPTYPKKARFSSPCYLLRSFSFFSNGWEKNAVQLLSRTKYLKLQCTWFLQLICFHRARGNQLQFTTSLLYIFPSKENCQLWFRQFFLFQQPKYKIHSSKQLIVVVWIVGIV